MDKLFFRHFNETLKRIDETDGRHMFYINDRIQFRTSHGKSGFVPIQVDRYGDDKLKSIWIYENETLAYPLISWKENGKIDENISLTAFVSGVFEEV